MDDFEDAKDKILLGLERRNAAINERERRVIAYHEAGHAIVAQLLPETDKLHKITIIPRGMAMGLTQQIPFEERYTYSLVYLLNRIKVLLGGRVAEKIVSITSPPGPPTTSPRPPISPPGWSVNGG